MTTGSVSNASRNRSSIGRTAAAIILALLSLTTWALASPVGSSPDDDFHVANIYCIHDASTCRSDDVAWPENYVGWSVDIRDRDLTEYGHVKEAYPDLWKFPFPRQLPCYILNGGLTYSGDASQPATCLNAEDPADNSPASLDSLGYYPSLNYRLLSVFTQDTIRGSVVAWRLVTVLLCVTLAVGSVLLSLTSWRQPLTISWLVGSMPLGMFLFASHNPSALASAATMATVGPGVALLQSRGGSSLAFLRVGFLTACLLITVGGRNEGIGYAAVTVAVILILGLRTLNKRVSAAVGLTLLAGVMVVALSGLWRQPWSQVENLIDPSSGTAWWDALAQAAKPLAGSYSTSLGWLEILLPHSVTVPAAAAFWGALAIGLGAVNWRKSAAVIGVLVALIAFPFLVEATSGRGIQARYYLPLTFLLLASALSPLRDECLKWSWIQRGGVVLALIAANTVALLWVTIRYVRGVGAGTMSPPDLLAMGPPEWWWEGWLSPFSNWAVGAIAFAGLTILLLSKGSTYSEPEERNSVRDSSSI